MDKNAIKKYAVWARRELIERVSKKALQYGITADGKADPNADSVDGRLLSNAEKKQRQALIRKVNAQGYEQVMEEVAYTWFNRFVALRFMEVNGYLPSHVRVFTNDAGEFKPQILSEAIRLELDGLDKDKVYELKTANKEEELFKYLLIVQCNALNQILPGMFQRIEDYTELLLPDYLLREGSVIEQMVNQQDGIPESDWTDQVQIIGWLYQYYISEKKDQVFAGLKKNIKITKENIPAATQLFTPDWIVRYMVENSLGRLWLEGHPNDALKAEWKYYLEEARQEEDVQKQLDEIRKEYAALKPEELRCIDPCSGSGHILVYMFDILVKIYEDYGYTAREAVTSIIENNLWGLDIDERAAQLSYFAVMMKARQYDHRFFNKKDENGKPAIPQPHVYAIEESNDITSAPMHDMGHSLTAEEYSEAVRQTMRLVDEMHDAKEYGSIIHVTPCDWNLLRRFAVPRTKDGQMQLDIHGEIEASARLQALINIGETLAQKYHAIVTNPPYMGLKNMSAALFNYVMTHNPTTKNDLYGVFIQTSLERFAKKNGHIAMITQHVWMFTSGFEKYRSTIFDNHTILSLVHLGTRAFEEISGEVVQTCAFVIRKTHCSSYNASYVRLVNELTATQKEEAFLHGRNLFTNTTSSYEYIPGHPICYWLNDKIINAYKSYPLVSDVSSTRQGLKTSDDKRFIRFIFEVDKNKIAHDIKNLEQAALSGKKWFWLNKGGQDKWYGNNIYLINWENDGAELKDYAEKVAGSFSKNITAIDAYFKECLSWPQISISHPSFRYIPTGYIFASAGPSLFVNNPAQIWYFLGFLNSYVTQDLLDAINPTINFGVSDILKLPFCYSEREADNITKLVKACVELKRTDWNSFEISWDFTNHPLVRGKSTIQVAFVKWKRECENRFQTIKANEEELNRIFIDIYGLQDELTPEVEDKDITVRKADLGRDIRSLISYAVGCMFGRYSLDVPGLAYAGGTWDASKYTTFLPDKDAIIPVCDDEYFEDDIVSRFVKFVEVVYGKKTLEENLQFIADALGGKGSSREAIRNYFMNEFYKDHCKIYQKRPIYWLFDSGKKNGFKCLIYMHRYQPDTIARIRTDYVHEQQSRYRTAIMDLEKRANDASTSERVKLNKQLATLQAQATELREYEEKIHHLADQMIKIDLDDGVKHNYEIFKDVLAKIK